MFPWLLLRALRSADVEREVEPFVGPIASLLAGVAALESGQMEKFGQLMFQSHESSRRNFENSTAFLDALVEIAATIQGVLGARLTGGGFGGSTIWLVERDKTQDILTKVSEAYRQRTGATCKAIITKASQGARLVEEHRLDHNSQTRKAS